MQSMLHVIRTQADDATGGAREDIQVVAEVGQAVLRQMTMNKYSAMGPGTADDVGLPVQLFKRADEPDDESRLPEGFRYKYSSKAQKANGSAAAERRGARGASPTRGAPSKPARSASSSSSGSSSSSSGKRARQRKSTASTAKKGAGKSRKKANNVNSFVDDSDEDSDEDASGATAMEEANQPRRQRLSRRAKTLAPMLDAQSDDDDDA
jgi:hypothetical protein